MNLLEIVVGLLLVVSLLDALIYRGLHKRVKKIEDELNAKKWFTLE